MSSKRSISPPSSPSTSTKAPRTDCGQLVDADITTTLQPATTIPAEAPIAEAQECTVVLLQEEICRLKTELESEKKYVDALKKQVRFWKNKSQSPLNDSQTLSSSPSQPPVSPLSRYHQALFQNRFGKQFNFCSFCKRVLNDGSVLVSNACPTCKRVSTCPQCDRPL